MVNICSSPTAIFREVKSVFSIMKRVSALRRKEVVDGVQFAKLKRGSGAGVGVGFLAGDAAGWGERPGGSASGPLLAVASGEEPGGAPDGRFFPIQKPMPIPIPNKRSTARIFVIVCLV